MDNIKDEELIKLIKENDKRSESFFYARYYEHSKKLAKKYYYDYKRSGITLDEFISVAFSSVGSAFKSYDKCKTNFYNYWKIIARNAIIDYLRENSYTLGAKAFGDISFSQRQYNDEGTGILFEEIIGEEDEEENARLLKEHIKSFIYSPDSPLTNDETLVAHFLFYRQYNAKEIMSVTHWSSAKTYREMSSARTKISEFLKNGYFK